MVARPKGYSAVAVPLPGGVFSSYVFVKEHREGPGSGAGRTLFAVNVDDDGGTLTDAALKARLTAQWEGFGPIDAVELVERDSRGKGAGKGADSSSSIGLAGVGAEPLGTRARCARIRFSDAAALKRALAAKVLPRPPDDAGRLTGLAAVVQQYRDARPDHEELRERVDAYINLFDAKEAEEEQERLDAKNQPDADGFVTVTYKKRRREAAEPDAAAAAAAAGGRKKKKKPQELHNFYRFQMREAKREQLATLREKFEQDKAKIERMKAARKFKPF
eukprot:TRINITY_DN1082_c0_g1_i1.p1 TRINITY_DN1082_c0_g1~~TRINITY_DN1082_c0_g1_i1.p1  ORF type:complete len:276 (+),score=101.36 TRINITY_DN1082_c0_g1_i1:156-983(+)